MGQNTGPSGYKARPAGRHYRALADMARSYGVVNGKKIVKTRKPKAKS